MAIQPRVSAEHGATLDAALKLSLITRMTAGLIGILFILFGIAALPIAAWLLHERKSWVVIFGAACMVGSARLGWVMFQAARTGYSPTWDSVE